MPRANLPDFLRSLPRGGAPTGKLLAPIEPAQEVWACGVTYLRSREAREAESSVKDVYARVYDAKRPEVFWKSIGWRVAGHEQPIRVRADSAWNVPEPELTLVVNAQREIVGFCAGNDVSSRDIEGENPLYLPQAKVYNGSCALGPGILLGDVERLKDLSIQLTIKRGGRDRLPGRDAHRADQAPARRAGRVPGQGARLPARRVPDDRHRDRAADRLFHVTRRRRHHHNRRADAGESRRRRASRSSPDQISPRRSPCLSSPS